MKTAVLSGVFLAVNAGDSPYGGAPAPAPVEPAPAPYMPEKPAEVVPDTVKPPADKYDPPAAPPPVPEDPVYEPPTPVYDGDDDVDDDDKYGDDKPVDKPVDVVDDEYLPDAKPSPQYPIDMPDDDDDYYGQPIPSKPSPQPTKPTYPIHDPPSQEKCGALYVDVLSQYFHYILSHIDQSIVDAIIKLLQELLDMVLNLDVADEDTVMKVVEQVKIVGEYAGEHLFDDETKEYVLVAMKRAQETYGAIYKTSVDPDVAQAWTDLWEPCHPSTPTPDETYAPLVNSYYQAYSSYMEDGADSPVYQQHIDALCENEDEVVKKAAEETKAAVYKLQSAEDAEDGVADATGSSGKVVAALSVVSSIVAMLF